MSNDPAETPDDVKERLRELFGVTEHSEETGRQEPDLAIMKPISDHLLNEPDMEASNERVREIGRRYGREHNEAIMQEINDRLRGVSVSQQILSNIRGPIDDQWKYAPFNPNKLLQRNEIQRQQYRRALERAIDAILNVMGSDDHQHAKDIAMEALNALQVLEP